MTMHFSKVWLPPNGCEGKDFYCSKMKVSLSNAMPIGENYKSTESHKLGRFCWIWWKALKGKWSTKKYTEKWRFCHFLLELFFRNKQTKTNYYYLYLQVATSWSLLQCVAKLFTYMLTITTWRFSVLAAVFISFWLTTSLHSNHFPLPTQTWLSLAFWPSLVIFPYSSQKSFWPMLCLSLGIYTWVHLVIVPLTVKGGVGGGSSAGGSWGYCFPVACACC